MARILLISCNVAREPYPVYPLGMTMVADAARKRGHDVTLFDVLLADSQPQRAVEAARACQPDVVGLSMRNIDNIDSADLVSYTDAYAELGRLIRECTQAQIVLGGAGYSLFPELLLEQIGADYGIVGEGETAFCELLEQLAGGPAPEKGIVRGRDMLTGDAICSPVRDPELTAFYLQEGGMLNLQSKRGCPFRCAYCTYPLLEGDSYRFRPPGDVADEMVMLAGHVGAEYVAFTDSVFNDRQGNYLAIAEELVRRNNKTPWMAFFRPQQFEQSEVDLLKRAGLHAVEWGTDCTTDVTLAGMRKAFKWSHVETSNRMFAEAGIRCAHFVIFGGPGETEQTVREGLANVERLSDCVVFAFCGVRILPGTSIHGLAVEQGVVDQSDRLLPARFYFSPEIEQDALHETVSSSFSGRMDRIYPVGRDIDKVKAFHTMGYRGPIWDLLLSGGGRGRRARRRRGA